MDKTYFTTSPSNLVINTGSNVLLKDIITFTKDGKTVGQLDAMIDFKDLNPELHMDAIHLLNGLRQNLYLPSELVPADSHPVEPAAQELGTVWKKIKKILGLSWK